MTSLPDINVLLALAWNNHTHHEAAHRWFALEAAAGWATCLLTQAGFLRLSMNPKVVGVALDCQAAVSVLAGLVTHPHHQFVEAAPALTAPPFDELVPKIHGYRQIPDATLLHLARVHGMKLVTFDQGGTALCPWTQNLEVLTP